MGGDGMPNYRINQADSEGTSYDQDTRDYSHELSYSGNYRIDEENEVQEESPSSNIRRKSPNNNRQRLPKKIYQYSDYYSWDSTRSADNRYGGEYPSQTPNTYADYDSPYENQPLKKWYYQWQNRLLNSHNSQLSQLPKGQLKLLSVVVLIFFTMLVAGWQLTPFHMVNQLVFSGNQFVESNQLAAVTAIRNFDSVDEVVSQKENIESKLVNHFPIIESIVFKRDNWRQLEIVVNEHHLVATAGEASDRQFVLENGQTISGMNSEQFESVNTTVLPQLLNFTQDKQVTELSRILSQVEPNVLAMIDTIQPSNDPNKPNGIEVMMKDGNIVYAIIVTFAQKINHYPSMLEQIGDTTGVINLEVGAYFVPTAANQSSIKLDNQ